MERAVRQTGNLLCSLVTAAAVFCVTLFAAGWVRGSEFYSKSRIISMIVSQEEVGFRDFASWSNINMLLKFAGALTSAYIDFEMIPVGEVGTFMAVFESLGQQVEIEKFEYHRKDLTIVGNTETEEEYTAFLQVLRETEYFEEVTEVRLDTQLEKVQFEIECISQSAQVHLELPMGNL